MIDQAAPLQSNRKFWDSRFNHFSVFVQAGTHYVTQKNDEMITTTLGSCISVCVRDRELGIGGMNHFMLPKNECTTWEGASSSMRYGNHAMEVLINDILSKGGAKNRLEFKAFGGADMIGKTTLIGTKNVDFIETYLRVEHMALEAHHLGGERARKLIYFPSTGKAKMKLLDPIAATSIICQEVEYKSDIENREVEGSIELF